MFARLLIIGCVVVIGTALMINLGAAMGMLPTKGMPLPLRFLWRQRLAR